MTPDPGRRGRTASRLSAAVDVVLRHRGVVKFFLHIAIFVSAYVLAYLVRFEFSLPRSYMSVILGTIPVLLIAKALAFLVFDLFRGWWRYVSIKDIMPIASGCTLGSLLFALGVETLYGRASVPLSVYLLDWGITLFAVLGGRYAIRMGRRTYGRMGGTFESRVVIVGAGSAGQMIAREIWENPALGMTVVGFIDDDPDKIGTRIEGFRVLGNHERIEDVCRRRNIDEVIIAIPSASPSALRHIVEHCREAPARCRILPGVGELLGGRVTVSALRNVRLEDLLGRDPVTLDGALLRRDITGQVVMVTGAAGSIGSELCRQVARLSPARLVLFEVAETPLFEFELELHERFPRLPLLPVIGDIRDRARVEEVVAAHRPDVIYHAAAYKHVPVMEMHPVEAVKNNVFGTQVVAEAAARCGVKRFVLVSTDKAVRPTNVMGATKRVAELIIQNMNGNGRGGSTAFVAVRFGNVLDSVGSVIPIFRRQIEASGRLTVTHPEASRYFMLIPEAAGLILQAGAMGTGGEVFVLDMGEPVNILDLAKNMIRLSGRELGVDSEIVFTGLRPGEKLHEELIVEGEDVERTHHPKVLKLIGNGKMPRGWARHLDQLHHLALRGDKAGVIRRLDLLVKGYAPDYAFHGIPAPPAVAKPFGPYAPPPPGDRPPKGDARATSPAGRPS
jgi:FlaA1/EpsC-like NDP-sugar epimerase